MRFPAFLHRVPRPRRRWVLGLLGLLILDLWWTLQRFPSFSRPRIVKESALGPQGGAVLVLGAGVLGDGEPTRVLEGRLRTALNLWREGKVKWFLVSGDNRTPSYNEPQAMRRWLLKQGVPRTAIVEDYAGRRTYDSLRRARVVFGVRRCVLVTSDFHLPRALFLAHLAELDALGVPASTTAMDDNLRVSFWTREYLARHKALWDAWFPPATVLGPREPTPEDLPQ